jgi:hypothetical protein
MIHQIPFRILETTKPAPELLSGNAKRLSPLCFHNLTNPSSTCPSLIDFYFLCFHPLTNPFSGKAFVFTSIQNPPGVTHPRSGNSRRSPSQTSQAPCFHTIADSLSSPKKSSALESATSTLFRKNTGGGGGYASPILGFKASRFKN